MAYFGAELSMSQSNSKKHEERLLKSSFYVSQDMESRKMPNVRYLNSRVLSEMGHISVPRKTLEQQLQVAQQRMSQAQLKA